MSNYMIFIGALAVWSIIPLLGALVLWRQDYKWLALGQIFIFGLMAFLVYFSAVNGHST